MPAHDIAVRVRSGSARAVDVVGEALDRAEASPLNDYIGVDRAGALERAAAIDAVVAAGGNPGPLAGVPIALKDMIDQAGAATTVGSRFLRRVPDASATVVTRLEDAGAVVIGRTNLHEFAYGFSSENHWFGPVHNPWDHSTATGGSSGGSAAAVAAGSVPLAIGTDTGGSVRVPAALCGVVGLKPTHGRVPLTGVFPLAASLDTVGPIATRVGDLAVAHRVMAGEDPADPWSIRGARSPRVAHDPPRIGVPRPWVGTGPVHPDVLRAFDETLVELALLGMEVIDLDLPDLIPGEGIDALAGAQIARVHRAWVLEGQPYGPEVAERLDLAVRIGVDDAVDAAHRLTVVQAAARTAFREVDVLATPTTGITRKVIGDPDADLGSAGTTFYRPALSWFTALVNFLGAPAISLPLNIAGSPPPSIQFIAPRWSEELLIGLGRRLERTGLVGVRAPG